MKRIVISGYSHKNDGPSVFINSLKRSLVSRYMVDQFCKKNCISGILKILRADVLILNSNDLSALVSIFIKLVFYKKKVVSVIHGEMGLGMNLSFKKILLMISEFSMLYLSNEVVFVSEMQKTFFERKYRFLRSRKSVNVIHNCIELDSIESCTSKKPTILYVGGKRAEKGYSLLCDLIKNLSQFNCFDGYTILLVGMERNSVSLINNIVVNECVSLSRKEIISAMSEAEIFLSLSMFETFGIACLEAYASKAKIVCYHKCGFLEAVDKSNCYISQEYNVESFCEQIKIAKKNAYIDTSSSLVNLSEEYMGSCYSKLIEKMLYNERSN